MAELEARMSTLLPNGRVDHWIDGRRVAPRAGHYLPSIDPSLGTPWIEIPAGDVDDVAAAVEAAKRAFRGPWRALPAMGRAGLLRAVARKIAEHAEELATIECRDNGKPIAEARAGDLPSVSEMMNYWAGAADKIHGETIEVSKTSFNFTLHEPLGVVGLIVPWNSPLAILAAKVGAALAAGNTVVLKPAEQASASILAIAPLFDAAGFPPGVVNVVAGTGAEVGDALVSHPLVGRIAFTGGPEAGRMIAQKAAQHMKRVTLELGGKSPNIVFDDADLDQAVKGVVAGIFAASGQTCVAGSRLLVQETIHDAFLERLRAFVADVRFGHPADPQTQIAPISTRPQMEKIRAYVDIARREGARLVAGGEPASVPGYPNGLFYRPTIFADVRNDMRIAQEEVFGPVLAVIRFRDEDDAVRIANDTQFGLAAGVWTQSMRRALAMADRVRAGTVWVNNYRSTSTTSPFGGFKMSGIGREGGIAGIREYMEVKSVWISTALEIPNPFIRR
jgi:aldehyde dehydrogenase (NAD+)